MSVICYEPKKFQKIAISLKQYRESGVNYNVNVQCFAHLFGYPEGWKDGFEVLEYKIDTLMSDLHRANQQTYLRQYEDEKFEIEGIPEVNREKPYENKIALYKALKSIRYNICDNNGGISNFNGCEKTLDLLIEYIADDIITAMPEYDEANVW